ncbi:MAG: glycosyltransferase [Candidatus Micrarchaeota archaeon]
MLYCNETAETIAQHQLAISVIIPTWNEADNIEKAISEIIKTLESNKISYEIIVADDNSKDGTKEKVASIRDKQHKPIALLNRDPPPGFGYSIRDAIRMANGEMSVVMMADLSDDPKFLPEMKQKFDEGCDVIVGSRFVPGAKTYDYPFLKMLSNRLFNTTIRIFFWTSIRDTSNAFKAFRTAEINQVPIDSRGFEVSAEMMLRMLIKKKKICEIPVTWTDRTAGQAKFKLYNTFINYFILFLKMLKLRYLGK